MLTPSIQTFGLDISDWSLRIVQLKKRRAFHKKEIKIDLVSFNEMALPSGLIQDGEIKNPEKIAQLVKKLVREAKGKKIKTKYLVSSLPETQTFIKVIDVPFVIKDGEAPGDIKDEIIKHIPLSLEETCLDWQNLEEKMKDHHLRVQVGAVPKKTVASLIEVLKKAEFTPVALEIEAQAITRCLISEKETRETWGIIDIGAARSSFILYSQGTVQFTVSMPISGRKITETISRKLNLSFEDSEKAKIVCGLDKKKCKGALREVLPQVIKELVAKIESAIKYWQEHFPETERISQIILTGGGANFLQLEKILSETLGISVKKGNPLVKLEETSLLPREKVQSFTTAIGLALRGV